MRDGMHGYGLYSHSPAASMSSQTQPPATTLAHDAILKERNELRTKNAALIAERDTLKKMLEEIHQKETSIITMGKFAGLHGLVMTD